MVPNTGLEPVTSSMSWKHSTTELIGHLFLTVLRGANNTLGLLKPRKIIWIRTLYFHLYRILVCSLKRVSRLLLSLSSCQQS